MSGEKKTKTIWVHSGGECPACAALKGMKYDHDPGDVSMHPNCQCVAEPIEIPIEEEPLETDTTGRMISPRQKEIAEYKEKYGDDVDVSLAKEMEQDFPFHRALAKTFQNEGGYVDDPDDRGGETNRGISRRVYKDEDIQNLTPTRTEYLYYRDYWKPYGINQLPYPLSDKVFDMAILNGQGTAVKNLQRLLKIKEDGLIGVQTLGALKNHNVYNVLRSYKDTIHQYHENLYEIRPELEKFAKGWYRRVEQ